MAAGAIDADETFIKNLVKEKDTDSFHRLGGAPGIVAVLDSDVKRGILGDAADVLRRKEAYGENTYAKPKPKTRTFLAHFLHALLGDVFLVALLVCAAVSVGFGIKDHGLKDGWYDGVGIILVVFLVSGVSAAGSHSDDSIIDKLASDPAANTTVTVVRAGRRHHASILDVVVGDVVMLTIGDNVPADGVYLEGYGLVVDESGITGDPDPIHIDAENSPLLSSGGEVLEGYGTMLVTAVGTDTTCGELMTSLLLLDVPRVPLQERLEGLTTTIANIGVAVSIVAFTLLAARHFTGSGTGKTPPLLEKGVPLAVTLMVTFSMRRMVQENNTLLRSMSALETMASATVICTDKTGALTLNQMKVTELWVGTEQPRAATEIDGRVVSLLRQGAGLNTTGSVYWPDNVSPPEISGSATEKALLSWAVAKLGGMDPAMLKTSCDCEVVHVEAFNSRKKHSRAIVKDKATGTVVAHWKGDAEVVLARCSVYMDTDGAPRELGVEQRTKLEKVIDDMAAGGLRCIAFAYKHVDGATERPTFDDHQEELTLLGFVGLKEPCRPDVKAAVQACRKAGVAVKMVTGDSVLAASSVAKECGIMSSNDRDGIVIEGQVFRAMSTVRQLEMVDKIRVMARSQPRDKLALVKRLKQKGHVVAVTTCRDGASDAPVLKNADVVLSMGAHVVAAKDYTNNTIILNDRFDAVVGATRWGRSVYSKFQKFIQFHLTVNMAAMVVNLVSTVTTGDTSLTTVQILWVNLVMGTMSVLAVAADTPAEALMERPPIPRTAPLISNAMWRNLAAQVAFQIAALLALRYRGSHIFDTDDKANGTMIFNVFVLCQVLNEFNVRHIAAKKKKMFLLVVAAMLVLHVLTVEVLTRLAGTERLGRGLWGACVAIAAMSWPVGWVVKFIPVPAERATSTGLRITP